MSALESLIKRMIKMILKAPEKISQIVEAVTNNPWFITPKAALVNTEQYTYSDAQGLERRCWKFVEAGMKFDPVLLSHTLENCKKLPININDDEEISPETFSIT